MPKKDSTKTVRLSDAIHEALVKKAGELQAKTGEIYSLERVIEHLLKNQK